LLGDPALRSQLGQNGAEIVRRGYQFPALEKGLEQVFVECGLDSIPPA